jgi:2-polyprenyl-6-methoxyphenol hydroxylase-like FAD-dependent oxidoreductase
MPAPWRRSTPPRRGARSSKQFLSIGEITSCRDTHRQKRLLNDAFAGAGWQVPELLRRVGAAPDFYFDPVSQIRMPKWTDGRVALVGDAAACPALLSGEGTSLALIGACLLAGELAAAGGDHRAAFDRYEAELTPYVHRAQGRAARGARMLIPTTRAGLAVRDLALRLLPLIASVRRAPRPKPPSATRLRNYEG